jgi:hypothetical protein
VTDDIKDITTEVLALDAAATPGPWEIDELEVGENRPAVCTIDEVINILPVARLAAEVIADTDEADARLIARYRTAAPELARKVLNLQGVNELRAAQANLLMDELKKAQEENKHLREIVEALAEGNGGWSGECGWVGCNWADFGDFDKAEDHDPTCPWRRAVEYVQERSEG